jgi:putative metallohydrolase (TIGR04338 family)
VPVPSTDARRSRVYAAEQQVATLLDRAAAGSSTVDFFGSTLTLPPERRFADLASVQRWLDAVLQLDAVRARWPGTPSCAVRARRGESRAHYEAPAQIAVPVRERWALRELVLCHEVAHHLVFHDPRVAPDVAAHGREFVDAFVDLVQIVIGGEVALLLRAGLDEVGAV